MQFGFLRTCRALFWFFKPNRNINGEIIYWKCCDTSKKCPVKKNLSITKIKIKKIKIKIKKIIIIILIFYILYYILWMQSGWPCRNITIATNCSCSRSWKTVSEAWQASKSAGMVSFTSTYYCATFTCR